MNMVKKYKATQGGGFTATQKEVDVKHVLDHTEQRLVRILFIIFYLNVSPGPE